ncbi:hypothetical protein [Verrucomicrobium spinosum]|uniref:hypothetical protein n=1 Tax=Verrucomicrobium spinosum TaxID=2736 RepID=UPI000AB8CDC6|nr:hypothetical protein [Verrucomicrobium spinosum]
MSFVETFNALPERKSPLLRKLLSLLEPKSPRQLEAMAAEAAALTRQHFGRTMRLFAPLYLSNECVNNCAYCGFSRDNPIFRVTLTMDQVIKEAKHLTGWASATSCWSQGSIPSLFPTGILRSASGC